MYLCEVHSRSVNDGMVYVLQMTLTHSRIASGEREDFDAARDALLEALLNRC